MAVAEVKQVVLEVQVAALDMQALQILEALEHLVKVMLAAQVLEALPHMVEVEVEALVL